MNKRSDQYAITRRELIDADDATVVARRDAAHRVVQDPAASAEARDAALGQRDAASDLLGDRHPPAATPEGDDREGNEDDDRLA